MILPIDLTIRGGLLMIVGLCLAAVGIYWTVFWYDRVTGAALCMLCYLVGISALGYGIFKSL